MCRVSIDIKLTYLVYIAAPLSEAVIIFLRTRGQSQIIDNMKLVLFMQQGVQNMTVINQSKYVEALNTNYWSCSISVDCPTNLTISAYSSRVEMSGDRIAVILVCLWYMLIFRYRYKRCSTLDWSYITHLLIWDDIFF